jgi:hypothetical protein
LLDELKQIVNTLRLYCNASLRAAVLKFREVGTRIIIPESDALRLLRLLKSSGLGAIATPTPGAILSSLSTRRSVKKHDRYYGTQAIFNLHLHADYERPVRDLANEFWSHVQSTFAPTLALVSNPPNQGWGDLEPRENSEENLDWFSDARLSHRKLRSQLPGTSSVVVQKLDEGEYSFRSTESTGGEAEWRVEADGLGASVEAIRAILIYFGLPPRLVSLQATDSMTSIYRGRQRFPTGILENFKSLLADRNVPRAMGREENQTGKASH